MSVIEEIETERARQVASEGWTPEHDDEHSKGEMALAAACYAAPVSLFEQERDLSFGWHGGVRGSDAFTEYKPIWPWSHNWWKPKDRRCDLIRIARAAGLDDDQIKQWIATGKNFTTAAMKHEETFRSILERETAPSKEQNNER